jgi:hypothetical protein
MTFVLKLFIGPRVPWRSLRMVLKLLDQERKFGFLHIFLMSSLEPIKYNEGEGKEGPLVSILPGKSLEDEICCSIK